MYYNEFNRNMGYQQALLVSRKRESQVGQAPIGPCGFSLPFSWNIIFAIYIVKMVIIVKFVTEIYSILFYSGTDVVGAVHCIFRLRTETIWVSATLRILICIFFWKLDANKLK